MPLAHAGSATARWLMTHRLLCSFCVRQSKTDRENKLVSAIGTRVLLGRGNLRRDFSRIEFSSEAPVKAGHRVLRLIPKRSSDILEVIIEVEPVSLQLSRLSFLKSGQARIDFLLSNVQENISLADSVFTFKLPGGVTLKQY